MVEGGQDCRQVFMSVSHEREVLVWQKTVLILRFPVSHSCLGASPLGASFPWGEARRTEVLYC